MICDESNQITVTEAGIYEVNQAVGVGNVYCRRAITLWVADEAGNYPSPISDDKVYAWNSPVFAFTDGEEADSAARAETENVSVGGAVIDSEAYAYASRFLAGAPTFAVSEEGFTLTMADDGERANARASIVLNEIPETGDEAAFQVTMTWDGFAITKEIKAPITRKEAPAGIVFTDEGEGTQTSDGYVTMTVGKTLTISGFSPANWAGDVTAYMGINTEGLGDYLTAETDWSTGLVTLTAKASGVFSTWVQATANNVSYGKNILFTIADEDGNVQETQPIELDMTASERLLPIAPLAGTAEAGKPFSLNPYVASAWIANDDTYKFSQRLTGDPVWTVTATTEGAPTIEAQAETSEEGIGASLMLTESPTAAETFAYQLQVTWGGAESQGTEFTVTFFNHSVTGIADDGIQPLVLLASESNNTLEARLYPADDRLADDFGAVITLADAETSEAVSFPESDEDGMVRISANQPGAERAIVTAWQGSLIYTLPVLCLVTEDGSMPDYTAATLTLPASLTALSKNAFSGAKTAQQVILNETLKTVAPGAFAGCAALRQVEVKGKDTKFVTEEEQDPFGGYKTFVLLCPAGSQAEAFAVENGIPVIAR